MAWTGLRHHGSLLGEVALKLSLEGYFEDVWGELEEGENLATTKGVFLPALKDL